MKIKVVNGDDTRLWRYDNKYNLNGLNSFISSTWKIIRSEYIIQYEDDENDFMTIDNSIDLNDAIEYTISQNKKSLKVYVITHKNENELVLKAPELTFDSFSDMILNFLNNKEITKLLSELFGVLISKIIGSNISDIEYKKYAKYIKLRKIKMPIQSIKNRMKFDGFTQNEINIFVENKFKNKQKVARKYAKYIKLKKIKCPKNAIINKMKLDGFNQNEIDLFFEQTETKYKLLSIEEIINIIYGLIEHSQGKYYLIINHKLYVEHNNIIIGYIAEQIYNFQSVYKHFKFNTLQKWFKRLINILYKNIFENKNNLNDFNSIKYFIECNNLLITFPLETDYGKAIHFGIKCVDCNNYPIIGQRYKCYICKDINLCYKCEKHHNPTHPLIQFKKSSKITDIVIYNDDNKQCHDNNNNIECICGAKMEMKVAKLAYNWANCVFCDCCDKKYFNEMVYHCPKDRNVMHKQGFDLCISCSKRKVKDLLI